MTASDALPDASVAANGIKPGIPDLNGFCVQQGLATVNPNWHFVGERQGTYRQFIDYNYVGKGRGAYEQIRVQINKGWKFRKCSIVLLFAVPLFAVLVWLAWSAMQKFGQPGFIIPGVGNTANPAIIVGSTSTPFPKEGTEKCSGPQDLQAHSSFWWCARCNRGCPTTTSTTPAYDCNAGFANWKSDWSRIKKRWCCEHKQRGCTGTDMQAEFD